jgi:hypothetical protein
MLASKAPKSHISLMTDQGFDPQTSTTEKFVEICECAETKQNIRMHSARFESDDDSANYERHAKKPRKPTKKTSYRAPFFCKEHGPNTTHDSVKCKVLLARKQEKPYEGKKRDSSKNRSYKDYQSKYKKKSRELNILQSETKKEKAKWKKAYNNLRKVQSEHGP